MKTKRVIYYIALVPDWQDSNMKPIVYDKYPRSFPHTWRIVRIEVDLPEVPEPEVPQLGTIQATVNEIIP